MEEAFPRPRDGGTECLESGASIGLQEVSLLKSIHTSVGEALPLTSCRHPEKDPTTLDVLSLSRSQFPPSLNVFIWKMGNLDSMDFIVPFSFHIWEFLRLIEGKTPRHHPRRFKMGSGFRLGLGPWSVLTIGINKSLMLIKVDPLGPQVPT